MKSKCETVIISDKAYNAMIRESFARHPVETGGILLGYILDNGLWVVMEMIPPGINGVFQTAYFEYDQQFVNYLGTSVANQYKEPLQVLGLWHRHPGSMDFFSSTDDGTNFEFASRNPYGVISGLVNIDPAFRLTMYHLDHNSGIRSRNLNYSTVDVEVGDDLIPEEFFELRYVDRAHSELHPKPARTNTLVSKTKDIPGATRTEPENETGGGLYEIPATGKGYRVRDSSRGRSRKWVLPAVGILVFMAGSVSGIMLAPLLRPKDKAKTETAVPSRISGTTLTGSDTGAPVETGSRDSNVEHSRRHNGTSVNDRD